MAKKAPKFEDTLPVSGPAFEDTMPITGPAFEDTVPVEGPAFEDTAPIEEIPTQAESGARGIAQGLTFSFADEISGAVEALFSDKTYAQARDESRANFKAAEDANPKTFLAGQVAGGISLAFVPGLNIATMAGNGVKGAAIAGAIEGSLTSAGQAAEIDDKFAIEVAKGTVLGAGLGMAFSKAVSKISSMASGKSAKTVITAEAVEELRSGNPMSDDLLTMMGNYTDDKLAANIEERALDYYAKKSAKQLTLPTKLPASFKVWKLARKVGSKLTEEDETLFAQQFGQYTEEVQDNIWKNFVKNNQLLKAAKEIKQEDVAGMFEVSDPLVNGFLGKLIRPASATAALVDDKIGTNFTGLVQKFSEAERMVSVIAHPILTKAKPIRNATKKLFKTEESRQRLFAWMDGQADNLSPEELIVAKEWQAMFKETRSLLIERGLDVKDIGEKYITHAMTDMATISTRLHGAWDTIRKQGLKAGDAAYDDFMEAAKHLGGTRLNSPAKVRKFLGGLLETKAGKSTRGFEASATFAREGTIPPILLENDVTKLFTRYVSTNLKSIQYRDVFEELHSNLNVSRSLGLDNVTEYFETYARSLSGTPSGFIASLEASSYKIKRLGQKMMAEADGSRIKKAVGQNLEALPDFLSWTTGQIYPNYLGWNLAAPIRNMGQTWLLTAPEVGGVNGYKIMAKGWKTASSKLYKQDGVNKFKLAQDFLIKKGLATPEFLGDSGLEAITEGMAKTGKFLGSIEEMAKLGMKLYGHSDTINRYMTYHAGQHLADDILAGGAKSLKYFNRLPGGIKGRGRHLMKAGKVEEFRDMIAKNLTESTQFMYTRADLSQYGRDWGRMATMFTKWPAMIMSDIERIYKYNGAVKGSYRTLGKYIAPAIGLMMGQQAMEELDLADNPISKMVLGKNITRYAPIRSIDVGLPPLIAQPLKFGSGMLKAVEGDLEEAGKLMGGSLLPFTPGAFVPINTNRVKKAFEEK